MTQKNGVKTSEFWTAVFSVIAGAVPAVIAATRGNATVAAIVAGISLVGPVVYIWGRSILKAEQTKQTDLIPDRWEGRLSQVLDAVEQLTRAAQAGKDR